VACAAVAAFLPGDAITLLLETIPLYILYEASILVASFVARRDAARERAWGAAGDSPQDPPPWGEGPGGPQSPLPGSPGGSPVAVAVADEREDPELNAIIDHIDPELSD
jgi:hypothetical protein